MNDHRADFAQLAASMAEKRAERRAWLERERDRLAAAIFPESGREYARRYYDAFVINSASGDVLKLLADRIRKSGGDLPSPPVDMPVAAQKVKERVLRPGASPDLVERYDAVIALLHFQDSIDEALSGLVVAGEHAAASDEQRGGEPGLGPP